MKLQSYMMRKALQSGKIDRAIDLVRKHFNLPRPYCEPRVRLTALEEPLGIAMWNSSYYYSWTSDLGFHTTDDSGATDRHKVTISTIQVFLHNK